MTADGRPATAETTPLPGPVPEPAPPRRPGSVRRTSHLDVTSRAGSALGGFTRPASIVGAARDLVTPAGGDATVTAAARLAITFDRDGLISSVDHEPAEPGCEALVGVSVGFGFRSSIKELLAQLGTAPLGLLVDDLSGAPAPAGYGAIRERIVLGLPEPVMPAGAASAAALQTDVCAGWRAGGLPTRLRLAGEPMPFVAEPPVAPVLDGDDRLAWHPMPSLGLRQSRRIRRLDVWPDGDRLRVDVMFRDSTVDPDEALTERVVHEYAVTAVLDRATRTVLELVAEPRSLPFPTDCPLAAASAGLVVGQRADDLRTTVRSVSRGPVSCTHLNDLFRSLADVRRLVGYLPA